MYGYLVDSAKKDYIQTHPYDGDPIQQTDIHHKIANFMKSWNQEKGRGRGLAWRWEAKSSCYWLVNTWGEDVVRTQPMERWVDVGQRGGVGVDPAQGGRGGGKADHWEEVARTQASGEEAMRTQDNREEEGRTQPRGGEVGHLPSYEEVKKEFM